MSPVVEEGLIVVLLGGALAWVLRPLRHPARHARAAEDARWRELVETKHALYRSILDLEFDQAVGKVSDADYVFLRRQQEAEALGVLARMDAMAAERGAPGTEGAGGALAADSEAGAGLESGDAPAGTSLEDRLEAEIAAARSRLRPQTGA
ncbi:MAG TPA: hypothetical protein VFW71_01545 [Actinomycetota bacterium]|nr:hypothetical protein [Actinomycetota bacterium]